MSDHADTIRLDTPPEPNRMGHLGERGIAPGESRRDRMSSAWFLLELPFRAVAALIVATAWLMECVGKLMLRCLGEKPTP